APQQTGGIEPAETHRQYELGNKIAKFDLTVSITEKKEKLNIAFQYSSKLFKKETMERYVSYLNKILPEIAGETAQQIAGIEILPDEEKKRLLVEFNQQGTQYPGNKTLHQLVTEQAERTPEGIAVSGITGIQGPREPAAALTYRDLEKLGTRLAGSLAARGVGKNALVGILTRRSVEMITGLLGILKTGSGYVPLNPKAPSIRSKQMLRESAAEIVVTTRSLSGIAQKIVPAGKIIYLDDIQKAELKEKEKEKQEKKETNTHTQPPPHYDPSGLAYVIFTSGSTGTPKGVPVTHANLTPLLHWGYKHLGIGTDDGTMQNLSYYFDWSVWEI
ncbi:MAG: AMP-binding protein, partial [bacterium]|nr:AMP-binding protein [bacterium]